MESNAGERSQPRPRWHRWTGWLVATAILALIGALTGPATTPTAVGAPTSDWVDIDGGGDHTCGIRSSGRLYCWGSDAFGQLGDGNDDGADEPLPVQVAGAATNWAEVDAGEDHTCARKSTNRILCWGSDTEGQLGDGNDDEASEEAPVKVAGAATKWRELGVGDDTTCARKTSKRLSCWGYGGDGQIGDGSADNAFVPTQVAGGGEWKQVSGGGDHMCAIKTNERLYCWGWDGNGQLGNDGAFNEKHRPTQVAGRDTDWKQVGGGDSHTCAVKTTGRLRCWGRDANGELGDGNDDQADETTPVRVSGNGWRQVSEGGDDHSCARKANGRLYCWGSDAFGQLGDGQAVTNQFAPAQVSGQATNWLEVETGDDHTCARKTTMRLFCWGRDLSGQVGNGGESTSSETTPVEVGT